MRGPRGSVKHGFAGAVLAGLTAAAGCTSSTSHTAPPVTSGPVSTDPPSLSIGGFTELVERPFLRIDGLDLAMDAYVPDGDGPWPVVVLFHGNSAAGKDTESNTVIAEEAARKGMLVFAPNWIAGDPFPLGVDDIVDLRHAASCATTAAQEWAGELGGDVADTVVYGFSAGAGPALAVMVAPLGDVPDCSIADAPTPVAGAVLGDGEYFFQSAAFDGAFAEDLAAMQQEVAALSDPARWPHDLSARVFTWAAADGTAPRPIADPAGPGNWLERRDPDGSIRADLERLGGFDDGVVDYVDAARFIDLRLGEFGLDTELVVFPGGHSVADKVDELVSAIGAVGAVP